MKRLILFLVLAGFATQAAAQSKEDFFKHDYARTPFQDGDSAKHQDAGGKAAKQSDRTSLPEVKVEQIEKDNELPELNRDNPRIISVGAVLNGMDQAHYEKQLDKLVKVVDSYDLDGGVVYRLGGYAVATGDLEMKLVARGGMVKYASSVPYEYNVNSSPSWIFRTEKGDVLLEGISNPERYINASGEFLATGAGTSIDQVEEQKEEPAPDKGESF